MRTVRFSMSGLLPAQGLPGWRGDVDIAAAGAIPVGPYDVYFTMMRPGQPPIVAEAITDHGQLSGDSQILFSLPLLPFAKSRHIEFVDQQITKSSVTAFSNKEGRLGKIVVRHVVADSPVVARATAQRIVNFVLSDMSFQYDVPLEVYQTDVVDQTTGAQKISVRVPFSTGLWNTSTAAGVEYRKFAALYREGIGSRNALYSFLCFFKIVEAIQARNGQDAVEAKAQGIAPKSRSTARLPQNDDEIRDWAKLVFPPWYDWNSKEISTIAPAEARGQKLRWVYDNRLVDIRNEISHGLLEEVGIIDVDDPSLLERVDRWLPYLRMMARLKILERCNFIEETLVGLE